ncbi:MAG: DUF1036 domain-containing protein [Hyphomicrobiaceae bacterium]
MTKRIACRNPLASLGIPALALILCALATVATPSPARADLTLCNMTASRVGVAIGRKEDGEWIAEGWWNIVSNACKTLFRGELKARFYYVHALDYDRGGEWAGKAFMCADDKAFTIQGVEDCESRGYRRKGYFEVDTQNASDWTIRLADPREPAAQADATEPSDN